MTALPNDAQYPDSWDEYVGQDAAKRELRVAVKSAKIRKANLEHILIASPYAGIGKSAIGQLIVRDMGVPVLHVTGAMKLSDVRMMFSRLEDGDIVFYDEIHKAMDMGKRNIEWMLHYLQDGVLMTPFGPEEVPQVTIIGATTDAGVLPAPILQRFKKIDLLPYSDEEGPQIAQQMAAKILCVLELPQINEDTARAIARAGSNQPRLMRKLLISLRDLALTEEIPTPEAGHYQLAEALEFSGLTSDGLPREAQQYLRIMYTEMQAEPAGAALLRERLGVVGRGLAMIEELLMEKDLLHKTRGGRVLSSKGIKRARVLTETGE